MIEAPHQVSQENEEHLLQEEGRKPAGTNFAIRAICFVLAIVAIGLGSEVIQLKEEMTNVNAQLAQSESATDQAKADLGKANSQATDAQTQLDRAKSLRTDLQAQLDRAQSQQSALQAQLDKARADLRVQADKAKAQASAMQAEIVRANDGSSELRRELDKARGQAEDTKSQLAASQAEVTRLQPLALRARLLPVVATFEKGFLGGKFTMHVKNLSPEPLKVTVTVAGSDRAPAATIEGGGTFKVDGLAAGASLVIQSDGYDPLSVTAR